MVYLLVVDTETTGLFSKSKQEWELNHHPWIVQFSFILYNTSTQSIVDMLDNFIQLPANVEISVDSTNIHKVTREMVDKQGKPIEEVFARFFHILINVSPLMLVGHNISFDLLTIKTALKRILLNKTTTNKVYTRSQIQSQSQFKQYYEKIKEMEQTNQIRCTMKENIWRCKKYPKLAELHFHIFQTIPQHLHNSLHDILITLRCFLKLEYDIDLFQVLTKEDKNKVDGKNKEMQKLLDLCNLLK